MPSLRALIAPASTLNSSIIGGSISGWSLAVKANLCVNDTQTSGGAASAALNNYTPDYTATVVSRAIAAGAHITAISNMDEFGMGSATAFSKHGASRNPYSVNALALSRHNGENSTTTTSPPILPEEGWLTPGGSSGGSAAAVATGVVRAALGSDTGGSVRQPASFCGIVGLKPTYGRIPRDGLVAYASSLDTVGVLTRNVSDARTLLIALEGTSALDDTSLRKTPIHSTRKKSSSSLLPLSGLRVGIPIEYAVAGLNTDTIAWWEWGAAALTAAGAQVVRVSLPQTRYALPACYVIAAAEAASNLSRYDGLRFGMAASPIQGETLASAVSRTRSKGLGTEVRRRIMAGNAVLAATTQVRHYDLAILAAERVRADFAKVFRVADADGGAPSTASSSQAWLQRAVNTAAGALAPHGIGVDVLLTPAAPSAPWVSIDTYTLPPLDMYAHDVLTLPASLAQLPAITIPVGLAAYPADALQCARTAGLEIKGGYDELAVPVGLQIIGRYDDDELVLDVAEALEATAKFSAPRYTAHV